MTDSAATNERPMLHKRPVVAIVGRPNVGKSTLFNRLIGTRRTGRKSGDLLETLVTRFGASFRDLEVEQDPAIKLVLVGRPNVGKSTLMNRLAGHSISVVHDEPGTTRDSTRVRITNGTQDYVLSDTAGLRRRSKVDEPVEYYSGLRASQSILEADVAVALIDGTEGVTLQDLRVMNQVVDAGCALVIAVNKWDLADRANTSAEVFRRDVYDKYPHLQPYQVLFISGLTGRNVLKSLEAVNKAYANYSNRITTASLNRLLSTMATQSPPAQGGREVRLLYATQQGVAPPTFVVFANRPDLIKSSYRKFFENRLRDQFDFSGTPIRTFWRLRRSR
jgi:GTP-binding protein